MSEFDNVTAPPPPPSGDAPQEDRTIALITHLSGIIAGFIVPLIIWLINKDKPEKSWLNEQAKEALNFQILIGVLINFAAWIACLVFSIIAGLAANKGEAYRYPFALRLIK